jgi:hypothetical protein
MRKVKKVLAVLLLVFAISFLFAACDPDNKGTDPLVTGVSFTGITRGGRFTGYLLNNAGQKYIQVNPDGTPSVQLNWNVAPENAADKKVTFTLSKTQDTVEIDSNGKLTFRGHYEAFVVEIFTKDKDFSDKLTIGELPVNEFEQPPVDW